MGGAFVLPSWITNGGNVVVKVQDQLSDTSQIQIEGLNSKTFTKASDQSYETALIAHLQGICDAMADHFGTIPPVISGVTVSSDAFTPDLDP